MRKKLAAVLLCMCMVLTLLPVSASAAGEYGLWVGGVQVDATTTTITGDGITGTVTYNNSTKTLTLDGATITGAHDFGQGTIGKAGIYYSGLSKLTIKLIGSNTITGQTAPRSSCGIFSDNAGVELEFTGSGNLNVTAAAENVDGGYSVPICSNGTITIAGEDTLTIVATSGGATHTGCAILIENRDPLVLKNSMKAVFGSSADSTGLYNSSTNLRNRKYAMIGKNVTPTYDISLSSTDITFPSVTVGYDAVTPQTVTVTNSGTAAAGELYVSLSGDSDKFTLSTTTTITVAANGSATFTVTPKTGLSAGTHTATVKIMKSGVFTKKLGVSFTVKADDQTPPTSTTPTVTITYENGATVTNPKVGETLYAKVTNAPENTTLTYLWCYNDGAASRAFSSATNDTYTLGADAVGKRILVQVRDNNTQQGEPLCQYVIGTAVVAADSTTPTPNPTTPTTPATGNHYRVFHVDAEKTESPKTADTGVMLYAVLSLVSLTGTAWWSKKRK